MQRAAYAKECPLENWKAAHGYAIRIAEEGAEDPVNDAGSEYHSAGSGPKGENTQPPETDNEDPNGGHDNSHPEGKQYDPDEVNEYPFTVTQKTDS